MKTKTVVISVVSSILVILLAIIYLTVINKESVADVRHAAGLGLAIPGDYMVVTSPQQDQVVNAEVQVQVVLNNPDPDYRLNLVVYLPRPQGLQFVEGAGMPVSEILSTDHISVPNLPSRPVEKEEIAQGVIWNGEVEASGAVTLTMGYDLMAPLPPTIQLRAIAYDGLSGQPVDEETLSFLTAPGQVLPAPTPRYSLTPVAVPDRPPGRVFSPTLAATLQSQSFEGHSQARQGTNVSGSDIANLPEDVYPRSFRVLSLTQCYYLGIYMINRVVLEFDTRQVTDVAQATLRLRALPPNPGGHTISFHAGRWEWLFRQEPDEAGYPMGVTNPAVWQQYDPAPLATLPISGANAVIANINLPRQAINAGGITRLLLISSAEAAAPAAGSCFAGGEPGLGGAITLPELFIK